MFKCTLLCTLNLVLFSSVLLAWEEAKKKAFDPAAVLQAAAAVPRETPAHQVASFKLKEVPRQILMARSGRQVLALGKAFDVYDVETGNVISKRSPKPLEGEPLHGAIADNGKWICVITTKELGVIEVDSGHILTRGAIDGKLIVHVSFLRKPAVVQLVAKDASVTRIELTNKSKMIPYKLLAKTEISSVDAITFDRNRYICLPTKDQPWKFFTTPEQSVVMNVLVPPKEKMQTAAMGERFLAAVTAQSTLLVQFMREQEGRLEFFDFNQYGLRSGLEDGPGRLEIREDEKHLLYLGKRGMEVWPLEGRTVSVVYPVDLEGAKTSLSADAMRAAVLRNDELTIYQAPNPPVESAANEFIKQLYRRLKSKQFDELDQMSDLVLQNHETFPWAEGQPLYDVMLQLLIGATAPKLLKDERIALLKEWHTKKPGSHLARLLVAQLAIRDAWEARGSGPANSVTPDGWKVFSAKIDEAHELLEPLLKEGKAPLETYVSLFEIAKAKSWSEADCEPYIADLLKRNPRYLTPHISMAEKLMPRWGGNPGDEQKYAARVADVISERDPPLGDALYAQIATKITYFEEPDEFFEVAKFDYERIQRGWAHLQKTLPKPDYGATGELYMADFRGDQQRAKEIVKRMDRDSLQYTPGVLPTHGLYDVLRARYRE